MNKTRIYLVLITLVFLASQSFAQTENAIDSKFKSFRMYAHSDFQLESKGSSFVSLLRTFSPSISWGKEYGNFHEIGIHDLSVNLNDYQKSFQSNLNYSYNLKIGKSGLRKKINFYAGIGGQVGAGFYRYPSYLSTDFLTKERKQSFSLIFTPRMTVKLSKNVLLDVNIPYGVYSATRFSYWSENPSVSVDNRKQVSNSSAAFPNQLTVRVGVSIKF